MSTVGQGWGACGERWAARLCSQAEAADPGPGSWRSSTAQAFQEQSQSCLTYTVPSETVFPEPRSHTDPRFTTGLPWWNLPAMQETWVQSLDREDPLEKGMSTHSSIPAWRIPWTEEPGGLQSMGSQSIRQD